MLWYYINLIFSWNSIYRWNNFPRVENISETDNVAFVLHIIMNLSNILEEKEKIKIDLNYIFKKIMFRSFIKFVISDIDNSVKIRLEKKWPWIKKDLENSVLKLLLSLDIPVKIKKDITEIYKINNWKQTKKYNIEDNLINYAKTWAAYYETYFNNKIYDYYYQNILDNYIKKLLQKKYETFYKHLPISHTKDNSPTEFLLNIRRLQTNIRWNKIKKTNNMSVMSHLFIVFSLSYIIWILENKTDKEILEMMKIWLYHDIWESITWDIISTTKKAVKWFDKLINDIEEEMIEEKLLSCFVWYKFKNKLSKYILKPWETELWKLVKIADIFSVLFESKQESNSEEFKEIFKNIKRAIQKFNYKSINYILNFWVEYFDDNLDEIIKNHFNWKLTK